MIPKKTEQKPKAVGYARSKKQKARKPGERDIMASPPIEYHTTGDKI